MSMLDECFGYRARRPASDNVDDEVQQAITTQQDELMTINRKFDELERLSVAEFNMLKTIRDQLAQDLEVMTDEG